MKLCSIFAMILSLLLTACVPRSPLNAAPIFSEGIDPSLRDLTDNRKVEIGAAFSIGQLNSNFLDTALLVREFDMLMPEHSMKMGSVCYARDRCSFKAADELVDFAESHDMTVRGHTLVWHLNQPKWLEPGRYSRDELMEIMHDYIDAMVARYRDRVPIWDVVNEALTLDGALRDTIWLRGIGPEYIDLAFRWAHEADPNARLFYNDYANEEIGQKSDAMYELVKGMLDRGVPIHGVGFQLHTGLGIAPDPQDFAANLKRFEALGLEVQVTEMDVRIQGGSGSRQDKLAAQARVYGDMFRVCLQADNCTAFVIWGLSDRRSWVGALTGVEDAPLLFDRWYRPKPAYEALDRALQNVS